MNAQQVLLGVVMRLKMALIGVADSLPDAMCKVNIGGSHHHRARLVHNFHDALQRMLSLRLCLDVVHEIDDLATMLREEVTSEPDETRGKAIMDAMAGRAHFAVRRLGFGQPLPSALVKDRAALRAQRGFGQLPA